MHLQEQTVMGAPPVAASPESTPRAALAAGKQGKNFTMREGRSRHKP